MFVQIIPGLISRQRKSCWEISRSLRCNVNTNQKWAEKNTNKSMLRSLHSLELVSLPSLPTSTLTFSKINQYIL